MTDNNGGKSGESSKGGDTEEILQNELLRERGEGRNSIGDVGSNRTLGGASSWETIPDDDTVSRTPKDKDKKSE